jgi:potassium channel
MLLKRYVFLSRYMKKCSERYVRWGFCLCKIPHPFTCRTAELSQLLRISITKHRDLAWPQGRQQYCNDQSVAGIGSFFRFSQFKLSWFLHVNVQKLKLQESLPEWNQPDRIFMSKYELFCSPQEAWLLAQTYLLYIEQKCEDVSKKVPTLEGDNDSTKIAQ